MGRWFRLRGLPRSALLLGLDEGDLGPDQFNTNVVVLELPMVGVDGTDEMRAAIGAEMEASNAEVSSVSFSSDDLVDHVQAADAIGSSFDVDAAT
jgi:hypothetical protein